jgi:hypothetical protein
MSDQLVSAKDEIEDFLVELMKIDSTTGKEGWKSPLSIISSTFR